MIIHTDVNTIGGLHACFGATADLATQSFYAEGMLGSVTFPGSGNVGR